MAVQAAGDVSTISAVAQSLFVGLAAKQHIGRTEGFGSKGLVTVMAGSPLYSILTPSQKQLPVGMVGELMG